MTWRWNSRKRSSSMMAIRKAPSISSMSSAEMLADDGVHKKQISSLPPPPPPVKLCISSPLQQATIDSQDDTTCTQQQSEALHSVRFSDVEIRPYRIMLGDNADTDLPLGLDWNYDTPCRFSVDEFEDSQHFKAAYQSANYYDPLTTLERYERLRRAGYTVHHIRQLERRRKIELVMEWAYRQNRDEPTPSPCCNGHVFFRRYVI